MVEKIYYPINEKSAKQAHEMMSFREYVPGSLTSEYKGYVDRAYDLADMVAEKRPEYAEKAYEIVERYSKKMADNLNAKSRIGCMCPSAMISGAGNFPVKKKEKQNAASDRNYQEFQEIQKMLDKIRGFINGKDIILSGDQEAIAKLEKKLENLQQNQEKMKAANRAIRIKDERKGNQKLKELGYTEEQIIELRKPDYCGRVGFADYALQNNNANIHRVEKRLKTLKAAKERGNNEYENDYCKVVENTEIMRLQLLFYEKPDFDTREILKKNGFRWSPKNGAWQRQLTENAKYALKRVLETFASERNM